MNFVKDKSEVCLIDNLWVSMNQSRNYFSGNTGYYGIDSGIRGYAKREQKKNAF